MIRYKGFCKNIKELPQCNLPNNAVQFREADNTGELMLHCILWSIPIALFVRCVLLLKNYISGVAFPFFNDDMIGLFLFILALFPHEVLHAICFPKNEEADIYITSFGACCYSAAVISKNRFIFISLLPAIILGLIPLAIWLVFATSGKGWEILYTFATLNLLGCCGDFYNAYNAIRQMPRGTYQQGSGAHSYWFYK